MAFSHAIIHDLGAAAVGPTTLTPFMADGNMILLEVQTTAGGTGTLTITAEAGTSGPTGGVPYYGVVVAGNAAATWTTTATNVAGTYRLGIPGLQVAKGDMVRLSYTLTAAVGNIRILAETYDATGAGTGVLGMFSPGFEVAEATHDETVVATGIHPMYEAKDYDGAALSAVSVETDATRPAASRRGVQFTMPMTQDGAATPVIPDATTPSGAAGGLANFMIGFVARAVQAAAATAGHAVSASTNTFREIVIAGFDWASSLLRTEEQNPIDTRDVLDTIVNVTNLADGNLHTVYFSLAHFKQWSIQVIMSDGTATDDLNVLAYASNQTIAGEPATITEWTEITTDIWGVTPLTNAAGPINVMDFMGPEYSCNWVSVTYQRVAGAANDADITVKIKRWY